MIMEIQGIKLGKLPIYLWRTDNFVTEMKSTENLAPKCLKTNLHVFIQQ